MVFTPNTTNPNRSRRELGDSPTDVSSTGSLNGLHIKRNFRSIRQRWAWCLGSVALVSILIAASIPYLAAGLILHPFRKPLSASPPSTCEAVTFVGDGVTLQGWSGKADGQKRGTVIYLHGVADNRSSGAGIMERFRKRGFDVISFDSRAHGTSGGEYCTYGFHEKEDLRRIIDTVANGPVILIGSSLGGAVSLQLAAIDQRVSAVVAAETFSDFKTVATERAPWFLTQKQIQKAFTIAEKKGNFEIDAVSPMQAAHQIKVPVLLIHGEDDVDTPPNHSRRIFANLGGARKLIMVPDAAHNQSLEGNVWVEIETWIDEIVGAAKTD